MNPGATRQIILSSVFIALGVVFPVFFHMAGLGKFFLPMFWPLAACGFFLSAPFAVLAGLLTPLVSFLLSGMPPPPVLQLMMAELIILALAGSLLSGKTSFGTLWVVILSLLLSRLTTYLIAGFIAPVLGLPPAVYSVSRMIEGIPGILLILIFIPPAVSRITGRPLFNKVKSRDKSPS